MILTWWAPEGPSFVSECGSKVIDETSRSRSTIGSLWIWKLGELQRAQAVLRMTESGYLKCWNWRAKTKLTRYLCSSYEFLSLESSNGPKRCFRQLSLRCLVKLKDSNIINVAHVIFNLVSSKVPKLCFRMWVKGDWWDKRGIKVKVVKLKEGNKIKVAHVNTKTWRAPKGPSFVSVVFFVIVGQQAKRHRKISHMHRIWVA